MALRLALEQPDGWELLLFGQVLTEGWFAAFQFLRATA
jgi:hypothetical protein